MPNLDLSQPADYALLTQGALGDLASLFGFNANAWEIVEASYNGVPFHVFKSSTYTNTGPDATGAAEKITWNGALPRVTDFGGRRKVKYQFPYRDGQTTDDLGRRPSSFEMEIVIFGRHYMDGYQALLQEFDDPRPGKLIHPVRGEIDCVVDEITQTHSFEQRKAVGLRVTFIEHNFDIGDIAQLDDSSVKSALAAALKVFGLIDEAINKVDGALLLVQGVKNLIKSYLAVHKQNSAAVLTKMNTTFNKGSSVDIPALLPVNIGGTGIATSTQGLPVTSAGQSAAVTPAVSGSPVVSTPNFVVVTSVSDPFNGVPVDQLSSTTAAALAASDIEKQVGVLRTDLDTIIATINASGASLELFDTVLGLKQTASLIQDVLERGIKSSRARIVAYVCPRLMSIREVAFANGLPLSRVEDIDLLNPDLDSVNFISKGTAVRVPVTT